MGYRMRTASDHAAEFPTCFVNEPAASGEERYHQEHHAFVFFCSACSASECLLYAMHAAALGLLGVSPSDQNLRKKRPEMIATVESVPETRSLGAFLGSQFDSAACRSMFLLRDVLGQIQALC